MKILHIGNVAGVPQTYAKYQRKLGHKADVIMRSNFTVFGADKVADKPIVVNGSAKKYTLAILSRAWKYDIIHGHMFPFTSKYIHRLVFWKLFVYHLHGTWIRDKWHLPEKQKYMNKGNKLIVATPELLNGAPSGTIYLNNPVDTGHFIRTTSYEKGTALFILRWKRQLPALKQVYDECEMNKLRLTVLDRNTQSIPYPEFPQYLQQFEFYMDTKTHEPFEPYLKNVAWDIPESKIKMNPSLSLTALQQLAMGGKVVNDWDIITKFPEEHYPMNVAKKSIEIYKEMLK